MTPYSPNEPKRIDLDTTDFADELYLRSKLEEWYLGNHRIILSFEQGRLRMVDSIFDEIIRRYGIRDCEFDYLIKDGK